MQTASDVERDRKDARKFLDGLREHLKNSISLPDVREWIQKKEDSRPPSKDVLYELLFTDEFVLKAISEYLGTASGLGSPNDALVSKGFLAESKYAKKQGWTSGSPNSANRYLFTKVFGTNSKSVLESWWGDSEKGLTRQSCPDWAFRDPCPRVICEGKFFRKGGIDVARRELVSGIYQCFYYLAHPYNPRIGKRPAWDYTYACLFAYDASTNGSLVEAWATLNNKVKRACWDTANIFVIVLPEK